MAGCMSLQRNDMNTPVKECTKNGASSREEMCGAREAGKGLMEEELIELGLLKGTEELDRQESVPGRGAA